MKMSRKLIIGAVAGLAVVGAGAAVAATQFGDPKAESEALRFGLLSSVVGRCRAPKEQDLLPVLLTEAL